MFSIFPSINQDNVFKLTSTKRKKKLFKFVRIHIDELLLRKTVLTQFQKAKIFKAKASPVTPAKSTSIKFTADKAPSNLVKCPKHISYYHSAVVRQRRQVSPSQGASLLRDTHFISKICLETT